MANYDYCILLFTLLIFSDFTTASGKPKFGCNLDDDYNLLDEIPNDGRISQDPIWTTGDIQKASFKDVEEFKEFIKALNIVNDKVQSSNLYNTLDNVITFWEDYSQEGEDKGYDASGKMYLKKFFQSYKERVTPKDGAYFAIELANQFMKEYPMFADKMHSVYLSSCNIDNNAIKKLDFWFKNNQLDENPSKLPIDYFHDHVMSFMEFQIGEDGQNSGTIVMDCGLSMNDIIVLMDGEDVDKLSHTRTLGSSRIIAGAEHVYKRVGAFIKVSSRTTPRKQSDVRVYQMCYVKKGICSFEEHTRKPWLASPDHSLLAHNNNGDVEGGIFVTLYDQSQSGIVFWQRPVEGSDDHVHLDVPFKNLKELYSLLNQGQNRKNVYKVARILGLTNEQMGEYIFKIGTMIQDEIFTDQLKNLHSWFITGPRTSGYELDYSDTVDVPTNLRITIA